MIYRAKVTINYQRHINLASLSPHPKVVIESGSLFDNARVGISDGEIEQMIARGYIEIPATNEAPTVNPHAPRRPTVTRVADGKPQMANVRHLGAEAAPRTPQPDGLPTDAQLDGS